MKALRYAASLPVDDPRQLSARLYTYNSVPYGARWKASLGRAGSVGEWLGAGARGPNAEALAELGFEEVEHPQWFAWTRRGAEPERLRVKLYVSPRPEHLPRVFERAIPLLGRYGAGSLKLGRNVQNVLRADKFMVYLSTLEEARRLAATLAAELQGTPAQGVPFTEACSDDLLVSRGGDPAQGSFLSGLGAGRELARLDCQPPGAGAAAGALGGCQRTVALCAAPVGGRGHRQHGVVAADRAGRRSLSMTAIEEQRFVLPPDVVVVPVASLAAPLRRQIEHGEGDFAVGRARQRRPSKVLDAGSAALLEEFRTPSTIAEAVFRYSRAQRLDACQTLDSAFAALQSLVAGELLGAGRGCRIPRRWMTMPGPGTRRERICGCAAGAIAGGFSAV